MSAGPNSAFVQIDFSQLHHYEPSWTTSFGAERDAWGADSGSVSFLDLQAPDKAMRAFNRALTLLKEQKSKEAIKLLENAVAIYPQFVSAHNALGLAYLDQQDPRARKEFETAAMLDDKFPEPFLNLGMLALSNSDFAAADSYLEKASSLTPNDPHILTALAFAENGDHKFAASLQTAHQVHSLDHRHLAAIHYIAASAAISLHESATAESELRSFIAEEPANPLAPIARKTLDELSHPGSPPPAAVHSRTQAPKIVALQTFPNSPYLQAQLTAAKEERDDDACEGCAEPPETDSAVPASAPVANAEPLSDNLFTIHQSVDETALFFAVSHHGRMVDDLSLSDIRILDDHKPPARILQFIPQSRLPLRLGLLIDTSDSVDNRFSFEKRAAKQFIESVLNNDSDLAFVAGFNGDVNVTQDFTRDSAALANGIDKLADDGETALFDAVYFASWKLAAYPDDGRVARVLVVLTDGEDNSSHRSLEQAIEAAEGAGVTVYIVSTSQKMGWVPDSAETDANKILRVIGERTGGATMFPGNLKALDWYLGQLRDVIRSRYLIAYRASGFVPDGKYRTLHVTAEKGGKRLRVQVRKGYYTRRDSERTGFMTASAAPQPN